MTHDDGPVVPDPPGTRDRRRARRWTALVLTAIVLVGVAVWAAVFRNDYPCNNAKGVGVSRAIDGDTRAPLAATPQDALRVWATTDLPVMTSDTRPVDGWIEYRGRWVHDMPNDSFYEVALTETSRGWFAGSYDHCTR